MSFFLRRPDRVHRRARWLALGVATLCAGLAVPAVNGPVSAASGPTYLEPPPPTPPDPPTPRPQGKLVPAQGALFGLHTTPDSANAKQASDMGISGMETELGRKLDIDNHYYTWLQNFPTWRDQWDITEGRIPMISWMGGDTIQTYNGKFDTMIAQRADAIKALGAPVFLRWFWEADGDRASKAQPAHSPPDYIKAWRHIHSIFDAHGVTNAVWVWCPVSLNFYRGTAQPFYPGDDVVDWICADGYNWAPHKAGTRYESFQELFQAFYDFGVGHNKPLMVGETGVQELQSGDKAKWLAAAHISVMRHYPNIEAFLYFDTVNANGQGYVWDLHSSPSAFQAYKDMANDPYFNQPHTDLNGQGAGPSQPPADPGTTTTTTTAPPAPAQAPGPQSVAERSGYWMLGDGGHVYSFGDAKSFGAPEGSLPSGLSAIDVESTPSGHGYWVVDDAGHVFAYGDAPALGVVDSSRLSAGETVTSLSGTPTGKGYWIFTSRGRALAFGDAVFRGDVFALRLNGPVLDSVPTPTGNGYYMVASDGGIFAFGDALFAGSMGGHHLNAPVQSLVPDPDRSGYWLVASDGGVFAFDAPFRGSMGGTRLNQPITGMVPYGNGYLMVASDGGVFNFSERPFTGSLGNNPPTRPITAVTPLP
jgi:hypothetical protein